MDAAAQLAMFHLAIGREGASDTLVQPSTLWVLSESIALTTVCRSSHLLFMAVEAGEEGGCNQKPNVLSPGMFLHGLDI